MLRLQSLTILCATAAISCTIKVDATEIQFSCERDGKCPKGYECVAGSCVNPAVPIDAALADASPSDGSLPDGAVVGTCDELFSEAPGYIYCTEEADRCHFNVNTAGDNCANACIALGSTCLTSYSNDDVALCTPVVEEPCEQIRNSQICVCARPEAES